MKPTHLALKAIQRAYTTVLGRAEVPKPVCENDPDIVAAWITELLTDSSPRMIARFGANELACVANRVAMRTSNRSILGFVRGDTPAWWRNTPIERQMLEVAGFFPITNEALDRFCDHMLKCIPLVDLLGSWLPQETLFADQMGHTKNVGLELLNPYFSKVPWTRALAGKRVLVVHPFASTIQAQYKKRELIFPCGLLPEFELITLKAVQSVSGNCEAFGTWFEALESMESAMDAIPYDIALIGCGAYGFPLAAHAKRVGKKAFHLGGSLQLLFGIRGKRWEKTDYNPIYNYSRLMNRHWVRPSEEETPSAADKVEGATYW